MQGAVRHVHRCREIESGAKLTGDTQRIVGRRRAMIAHDEVEGVGGDEILCEIGGGARDSGGNRRGDAGMRQVRGDELLELGDKAVRLLGRHVQPEPLHRNETILIRLVRAKDGTKRSCSDLMQNAKRTERVREQGARGFRVQ